MFLSYSYLILTECNIILVKMPNIVASGPALKKLPKRSTCLTYNINFRNST